jgi:hypothetical protein
VRRETPEDILLPAQFPEVEPVRIDVSVVRIFETETSEIEGRTWRIC